MTDYVTIDVYNNENKQPKKQINPWQINHQFLNLWWEMYLFKELYWLGNAGPIWKQKSLAH